MSSVQLILLLAVLLLVRVGQMLFISGSVRSKNAAGACVRLLLDLAVAALVLWAIGGAFVPGVYDQYVTWSHLFGISKSSGMVYSVLPLILIASAAVHGAAAERTRLTPVLLTTGLIAIILPLLLQLSVRSGSPDSGIGLATTFGGGASLAAAILTGTRKGKFNRDLSVNFVPGHNLVLQLIGVMILVIAFVAISRDVGTLLAGSSAMLAGAAYGRVRFGKIDTGLTIAATIGGLCAGGVGGGPTWLAVIVGLVVGLLVPIAVMMLEVRFRIDDVTAASPTHLVGGLIGMTFAAAVGFFTAPTWSAWVLMWLGFAIIAPVLGAVVGGLSFFICKSMKCVRLTESAEFDGTDLSELDVNGYPDFQQTMIKSYHLREL